MGFTGRLLQNYHRHVHPPEGKHASLQPDADYAEAQTGRMELHSNGAIRESLFASEALTPLGRTR